jgi:hypothetical protein
LTGSGKGYKGRNTMWIARDKSGGLFLYDNKPRKNKDEYAVRHGWGGDWVQCLPKHMHPEIIFETGPVKVKGFILEKGEEML